MIQYYTKVLFHTVWCWCHSCFWLMCYQGIMWTVLFLFDIADLFSFSGNDAGSKALRIICFYKSACPLAHSSDFSCLLFTLIHWPANPYIHNHLLKLSFACASAILMHLLLVSIDKLPYMLNTPSEEEDPMNTSLVSASPTIAPFFSHAPIRPYACCPTSPWPLLYASDSYLSFSSVPSSSIPLVYFVISDLFLCIQPFDGLELYCLPFLPHVLNVCILV